MTVASENRHNSFDGNDVTTAFTLTFAYHANADVIVKHVDSDDVVTTLTEGVDYTLSGTTLTYPIAGDELATGERLVAYRETDRTQELDRDTDSALELELDKIVLQIQELDEEITRCVQKEITDDTTLIDPTDVADYADAAAASAAAAAASAADAAADLVLTNADVVSTNADVVSTNADVVLTNADVVQTNADVVTCAGHVSDAETAQLAAETAQGLAEDAQTAAEAAQLAAETAQGLAEDAQTAAELAQSNAETAETNAETAETNAETAQGLAEDARDAAQVAAATAAHNRKAHVKAYADSNITLSGAQDIDGYTPSDDDRIGVGGQTDAAENGIYLYNSGGAWTRATDFDEPDETLMANFYVQNGTVYGGTKWAQLGDVATIGTDDINFTMEAGAGASVEVSVAQNAHGFAAGQPVRFNGTNYVEAQADSAANAEMDGIVTEVQGANAFKFAPVGEADIADWSGATYGASVTLTAGKLYYLDPDTAGMITSEDDISLDATEVSKPIGKALTTTTLLIYQYRGVLLDDTYAGRTTISYAGDLTDGVFTWNHNLGSSYPVISVYDTNGELVIPDVDVVTSNQVTLDFGSGVSSSLFPMTAVCLVAGASVTYNISAITPQDIGTASAGSTGDAADAGHVHALGTANDIIGFSAYLSATQSIPDTTHTKVQIDTEEFDTESDYDNSSNYRFQPSVAGKYLITAKATMDIDDGNTVTVTLYKNGAGHKILSSLKAGTGGYIGNACSVIVDADGSSDYFELYVHHDQGGARNCLGTADDTFFQAFLIR